MEFHENAIEWVNGQDRVTISLSNMRLKNKIRKLAESYPDEVEIISDNEDALYAHIPLSYVNFRRPTKRELTEEQKEELRERMQMIREKREINRGK